MAKYKPRTGSKPPESIHISLREVVVICQQVVASWLAGSQSDHYEPLWAEHTYTCMYI